MSSKKEIRRQFRDTCFKRDKYSCVKCGFKSSVNNAMNDLDVHHIVSRKDMLNGGYCPENGASLCHNCHIKAEQFYVSGNPYPGYSIDDLFKVIGSTYEKALQASLLIK